MGSNLGEASLCSIMATYKSDWITAMVLWVVVALMFFLGSPYEREYVKPPKELDEGFYDPSLAYTLKPSTVSTVVAAIVAMLGPIFVSLGVQLVKKMNCLFDSAQSYWNWKLDVHHMTLSIFEAFAMAEIVSEFVKLFAGRLRPDFYARLATNDAHQIREGKLSYPSGHASSSFVSMVVITLYLLGKLRVYHTPTKHKFLKLVLVLVPFMGYAIFVAVTRTRDNRHNFADINAGAIIGMVTGSIAYFLNYPSLFDVNCHIPRGNDVHKIAESMEEP